MLIDKFRPDYFEGVCNIDYSFLQQIFRHKLQYAAKGRHSIRHIIYSSKREGVVVMPVYACASIPRAVRQCGNDIVFCDIDERDLNISVDAFKEIISKQKISFLLVPSLYGNPADLKVLERICSENDIYMIDDAAQGFGAMIGNRYVGSFGNAGFFSFSPGKPLTASMGSFFWTDNDSYKISYKYNHTLLHKVAFDDFYYNRYLIYERWRLSPYRLLAYFNILLQKSIDILNDGLFDYERDAIGRLVEEYKTGSLGYRNLYVQSLLNKCRNSNFRILSSVRGTPNNQKIVLIFRDERQQQLFREIAAQNGIYTSCGYGILSDTSNCPVALDLIGRVVEIPIEIDENKMKAVMQLMDSFN